MCALFAGIYSIFDRGTGVMSLLQTDMSFISSSVCLSVTVCLSASLSVGVVDTSGQYQKHAAGRSCAMCGPFICRLPTTQNACSHCSTCRFFSVIPCLEQRVTQQRSEETNAWCFPGRSGPLPYNLLLFYGMQ